MTEDDFLWEMIDEYVNGEHGGDMRPLVQMIIDAGYRRTE